MPPSEDSARRENYLGGREHAKIKHFFLEKYLETLAFKTLQTQVRLPRAHPTFSYIDGFTGPWGAKDESYSDTSFGVALDVLKRVKTRLPNVLIKCVFCETRKEAFLELQKYVQKNAAPINAICIQGRFEHNVPKILEFVGVSGFVFAFIDPKGWNVDTSAIAPLLKGRWSEVLFTFMSAFIGRFPDYEYVRQSYAAFLGDVDWRARYEALPYGLSNEEKVFLLFRGVLKENWKFKYVLDFPIQKVNRDREFYKLVYGTRSPHGVLTFRDAQARAEKEGFAISFEALRSEQLNFFSADEEARHIAAAVGVGSPAQIAKIPELVVRLLTQKGSMEYLSLAAEVLEDVPAKSQDLKIAVQKLQKAGALSFTHPSAKGLPSAQSVVALVMSSR